MHPSQSLVVGGKEFPEVALSLAVSPLFKPNFLSASVVLSLTPVRRAEDGSVEALTEAQYRKSLIFSDIFDSNDPQVLNCLGKVQAAIQQLIIEKNL